MPLRYLDRPRKNKDYARNHVGVLQYPINLQYRFYRYSRTVGTPVPTNEIQILKQTNLQRTAKQKFTFESPPPPLTIAPFFMGISLKI